MTPLEPLAIDADGASAMVGLSRSGWFKLASQGGVPRPRRIGRRVLYDIEELRQWWAAGCPTQERWEAIQQAASKSPATGLEHGGVRGKVEPNRGPKVPRP